MINLQPVRFDSWPKPYHDVNFILIYYAALVLDTNETWWDPENFKRPDVHILTHNVKLMYVVTSDHKWSHEMHVNSRCEQQSVSAECLWSYHLRRMLIPAEKNNQIEARYLKIRPVTDISNPAFLQAIVSKSDFLAVWLLSGAANTQFPEASGRCGTSSVWAVALWLCVSDKCFFFIQSHFNYARNSRFVCMKSFHFIFL